jgi:hypothetical protein
MVEGIGEWGCEMMVIGISEDVIKTSVIIYLSS